MGERIFGFGRSCGMFLALVQMAEELRLAYQQDLLVSTHISIRVDYADVF